MDTQDLTIVKAHEGLKQKQFSAVELVQASLTKIKELDTKIKAFLTVTEESALSEAKKVDQKIAQGKEIGWLEGIPYSAKDVFCTQGIKTTASSKILDNFIPPYDATSITQLKQAGAILIGKTNNDPFGFGSSTENSAYQVTHNPWDLTRVPGGSSGGSAAAVITGMGLFSMAEDTGGSIRQPASFCSVSGLKVTYGRVSRYGVIAYGSSLDTIGTINQNVEDLSLVLQGIAGQDPKDATTVPHKVPNYYQELKKELKNLKIGLPKEYFIEGMDPEVEQAIQEAAKSFEKLGFEVQEISLPHTKHAISAYYLAGTSEVSANLARYDGIRFGYSDQKASSLEELYLRSRGQGFGAEAKRRIMLGTYSLSAGYYDAYYKKAQRVRTHLKADFEKALEKVDVILAPVSPFPPFKIGEKADDPLQMWLADVFTVTINPSGVPALAVPCGFTKGGLPIGMQIVGPQFSEDLILRAGHTYQQATDWHKKRPDIK